MDLFPIIAKSTLEEREAFAFLVLMVWGFLIAVCGAGAFIIWRLWKYLRKDLSPPTDDRGRR